MSELIWSEETSDPGLWSSGDGKVLMRLAEVLLRHGMDLEDRRHEGLTPLMLAAKRGNDTMAEFLIARGAIVEARDDLGQNVLHMAADGRDLQVMTLCLDAGLNANVADASGRTPLHVIFDGSFPVRPELTALLLDRGASANARDIEGVTVLHHLAKIPSYEWAEEEGENLTLLLAAGGDPFAAAGDGNSSWFIAVRRDNDAFLEAVRDHALTSGISEGTFRAAIRDAMRTGCVISEDEAFSKILGGDAGYYSLFADRPRPHKQWLCVETEGQWFLLSTETAELVVDGTEVPGGVETDYEIGFHDPAHPVAAMIAREKERFGPSNMTSRHIAAEFIVKKLQFDQRLPKELK